MRSFGSFFFCTLTYPNLERNKTLSGKLARTWCRISSLSSQWEAVYLQDRSEERRYNPIVITPNLKNQASVRNSLFTVPRHNSNSHILFFFPTSVG